MALYLSGLQIIISFYSILDFTNDGGNGPMNKIMFTWLGGACGVAMYTNLIKNNRMNICYKHREGSNPSCSINKKSQSTFC